MDSFKRIIIVVSILSCSFISKAQLIDSIAESFKHKPTLYANYGSYYSFITNQFAGILNIKLGADFNTTTKIGAGYNWIKKGMEKQKPVPGFLNTQLYMRYVSVFFEYTYFKTDHWEATIPAQIGFGNMYYEHTGVTGEKIRQPIKWFILYEPITTIQYRFLKYFAAGGGIGYRLVIPNKPTPYDHFTSVLFVVKTKFYFGDVYRDLKKWHKGRSE